MAVLSNTGIRAGASAAGGDSYQIAKSLRFDAEDSAYLSHTPSSSTSNQKQFTISFWTKVEGDQYNTRAWCTAGATSGTAGLLQFYIEYGRVVINGNGAYMMSARRLRDPAAWYHIVLAVDTTLSTADDRMKVWVNGDRITDWSSNTQVAQDASFIWNTNVVHRIGGMYNSSGSLSSYLSGLLADFHNIDGQALDVSEFGETDATTGKWVAKEYKGTYGPLVNQSQTWSDSVTNPSGAYGVAANAFDGDETTHASPAYANPMTYTNASPSDTVIQTFEVKCDIYTMSGITVELNDTDITSQLTTTDQWHTITGFTDEQFEKFYWRPSVENYEVKVKAIRINGKILVDDDVTVVDNSFYLKLGDVYNQQQRAKTATGKFWTQYGGQHEVDTWPNDKTGATYRIKAGDIFTGLSDSATYSTGDLLGIDKFNSQVWLFSSLTSTDGSYTGGFANGSQTISSWKSNHFDSGTTGWEDKYVSVCYYDGSSDDGDDYTVSQPVLAPDSSGNGNDWTVNNLTANTVTNPSLTSGGPFQYGNIVSMFDGNVSTYAGFLDQTSAVIDLGGSYSGQFIVKYSAASSGGAGSNDIEFSPGSHTKTIPSGGSSLQTWTFTGSNVTTLTFSNPNAYSTGLLLYQVTVDGVAIKFNEEHECDVTSDSPTDYDDSGNGAGSYATWNPLYHMRAGSGHYELAQGNRRAYDANNTYGFLDTTIYAKSGKWYGEIWLTGGTISAGYDVIGMVGDQQRPNDIAGNVQGYWYSPEGHKIDKVSGYAGVDYGATYALGDIIGVAMDLDNGTVTFYKNGVSQGVAFTDIDLSYSYSFAIGDYSNAVTFSYAHINTGFVQFRHTPPTGYKAMNTYNLPDPVIKNPSKYFKAKTYTGTGSALNITGLEFSPDLVWIKSRSSGSSGNIIDTVRGRGKQLIPSGTDAEGDESSTAGLTTFNSDGFSLGTDNAGSGQVNASGSTFISWNWDAGTANTINSSAYNGSSFSGNGSVSTPSGTLVDTWSEAFDGIYTSYYSGPRTNGTGESTFTFDTSNKPTWSSKFRINIRKYGGGCFVNGSTTDVTDGLDLSGGYWEGWLDITSDVGSSGTLSSIKITDVGNNYVALRGIELDDKVLYDSPPSVNVGGLDSAYYDQSETWSDWGDDTDVYGGPSGSYTWDNAFNGVQSGQGDAVFTYSTVTSTCTIPSGSRPSWSNKIRAYGTRYSGGKLIINGTDCEGPWTADNGQYSWQDITSIAGSSGTLETISVTDVSNGSYFALGGIELDGKLLVDNGISMTNVPTIASTYRANPEAGFSIVTYEGNATSGATIAHGLGAKPEFAIFKNRETAGYSWYVYHKEMGNTHHLYLNHDYAKNDDSGAFNDTDPDSNVFTLGNTGDVSQDTKDIVAYLWSEVEGYSKFGTYQADASTASDNAWLNCGFKPAFVLIKQTDSTGYWSIWDSTRTPINDGTPDYVWANDAAAEQNDYDVEFLSNGFKIRDSTGNLGGSGNNYVFAAFADKPFKYSNAQ